MHYFECIKGISTWWILREKFHYVTVLTVRKLPELVVAHNIVVHEYCDAKQTVDVIIFSLAQHCSPLIATQICLYLWYPLTIEYIENDACVHIAHILCVHTNIMILSAIAHFANFSSVNTFVLRVFWQVHENNFLCKSPAIRYRIAK